MPEREHQSLYGGPGGSAKIIAHQQLDRSRNDNEGQVFSQKNDDQTRGKASQTFSTGSRDKLPESSLSLLGSASRSNLLAAWTPPPTSVEQLSPILIGHRCF